jgi:NAD(P)-dependent dehydrogenase (short-subunit alcohol dehydrogenase family)
MSNSVAVLGAGGKMGLRAVERLAASGWSLLACEKDEAKAASLKARGLQVVSPAEAAQQADFLFMAVPDALIGKVASELVPLMKPGAVLIMLDAAAVYVGAVPARADITQMIAHPCHPPFFTEQATPEARRDFFGGIAWQDIVVSLVHGNDKAFEKGITLCREVFAPVRDAHRVSPEQFAMLEPAMSEIIIAAAASWMHEAVEEAVRKGVPRQAAEAFAAGHVQIALAIVFGAEKAPFSDAAERAIHWGKKQYISPRWKEVYSQEVLSQAIKDILGSTTTAVGC